ncbi:PREDICTED: uncharacterized protein LOC108366997 [Rhagoletis zephyria]|uniref:uncharacterized protein LOC108366997 n=1 Tax=Rhagoletis zephyria TaxID=28612 RepID=UPI0008119FCA|nr:PREDICTED: uncharacterized protein LOC108366997 [Rhagoletis zephyria]
MQQENKVLRDQLQVAIVAIADIKVVVNQLHRQQVEEIPPTINFPVLSAEQLEELNAKIDKENRALYVKSMKSLLQPAGVIRNLKFILSDTLMQEYNVDGIHGKKSLKGLDNFYDALIESIPIGNNLGPAEKQLRKAIQLQKNRFIKAKYQQGATEM